MWDNGAVLVRCIVLCGLFAGCRIDFQTRTFDGAIASGDVATDVAVDAPALCAPLQPGETVAMCNAALADPANAPDRLVFDCAISCAFGHCTMVDASTCTACACPDYAKSNTICDMSGTCTAPLSGTGCVGLGLYAGPPFNCTSANGVVFEGACMIRYLAQIGDC